MKKFFAYFFLGVFFLNSFNYLQADLREDLRAYIQDLKKSESSDLLIELINRLEQRIIELENEAKVKEESNHGISKSFVLKSISYSCITIAIVYVLVEVFRWYIGEEVLTKKLIDLYRRQKKLVDDTKEVGELVSEVRQENELLVTNVNQGVEATNELRLAISELLKSTEIQKRLASTDLDILDLLGSLHDDNVKLEKKVNELLDANVITLDDALRLSPTYKKRSK